MLSQTYIITILVIKCLVNNVMSDIDAFNQTSNENQSTPSFYRYFQIGIYVIIWLIGSIGGFLVIYVILANNKLKTITNTFLLNLAIADFIFLQGIPFYLTSLINREWIFSLFTCKLFWTFTGVNQFTAIFILTLLAFDRYLAVCRPDLSRWRKSTCSKKVLLTLWTISIIFMLPIILYSNVDTVLIVLNSDTNLNNTNQTSISSVRYFRTCTILWPENDLVQLETAFTIYGILFSYFIPILLISIFYFSIIFRLRKNKKLLNLKPPSKRKDRRKATYLVLIVISIYILTYTPHWMFQVFLTVSYMINPNNNGSNSYYQISAHISSAFQMLVYLNSTLNPFCYAFISEIFRNSFKEAINCNITMKLIRRCFLRFFKTERIRSQRVKTRASSFKRTNEFNSELI
ncbi:unnamed protein product [Brachionus calyciflorus]|uniref:G-protein coupled receptors family 1 profile domain-containing protein n=1 Tax=Brachionus calyciflorus TaxID=104777 RepID=A0A814IIA2_9BILA|nr:unnamed protein product [Brachionus calyciflorus]